MHFNIQFALWLLALLFILFFAGMQVSFFSVNRLNIELKKQQGKTGGIILMHFMDNPFRMLGITGLGFVISIVIYGFLFQQLMTIGVWNPLHLENKFLASIFNFIVELAVVTVVGVLLSAIIFNRNDKLFYFFAPLLRFFDNIFSPIVRLLTSLAKGILVYFFNIKSTDIDRIFVPSVSEGLFKSQRENITGVKTQSKINTSLFENALSLANVKVRQCMVPRTEIIAVAIDRPINEVREKFIASKLSKLIVYQGNFDNIVGYIHQLDLFQMPKNVGEILLPIIVVPETMSAIDLMTKFSKERKSMAWVIDEYGGTSGIITMQDIQEEIFGDFEKEADADELIEKHISEEEYIFSGRLELEYLNKKYGFGFSEDSETLSGYIINHFNAIPAVRDHVIIGNYAFDVMDVSSRRIETVKMRILR